MSNNYQPTSFKRLPDVIKNLIIINGLFFLGTIVLLNLNINLTELFGLYIPGSEHFEPWQYITHMFMHSLTEPGHIFMNMFMLWMFGNMLENIWGPHRFLAFYLITGLGAGLLFNGVSYLEMLYYKEELLSAGMSLNDLQALATQGKYNPQFLKFVSESTMRSYFTAFNTPVIGASGAVFGVLMAFGMLFPNVKIYLYFLFPIKAKYMVIGLGLFEFWQGLNPNGSNVAHFAHLGGMIFGFILIKYWQKKGMGGNMYY
jgi:membrane associated rhomboid family serine protease